MLLIFYHNNIMTCSKVTKKYEKLMHSISALVHRSAEPCGIRTHVNGVMKICTCMVIH